MRISVAMCTYNGERYLKEQLESIKTQTRPPDEIVVCDDRSQDGSQRIVQEFAAESPIPVRLYVNESNLGSTKNFEKAIRRCSGDIIALSDQDDVWLSNKVERIEIEFQTSPDVGLVFSDAELVAQDLKPLNARLWPYAKFTPEKQREMRQGNAFKLLLAYNHVTGATMAFRAKYRDIVLPIPENIGIIHDGWISLMIAAIADIKLVEQPLILYRQHPKQQMGTRVGERPRILTRGHYQAHLHQLEVVSERLSSYRTDYPDLDVAAKLARLKKQMRHLKSRLSLPTSLWKRFPCVLRELLTLGYHRYSSGFQSAARDLFYS